MDLKQLDNIIHDQGLNYFKMSQLMKMSHTAFHSKISGLREFKASELKKLKRVLCLSDSEMVELIFGEDTLPDKYNKISED